MRIENISFDIDIKGIRAFHTVRDGDCSGSYSGGNISPYSGDALSHNKKNLDFLASTLGVEYDSIIQPKQVHSDDFGWIDDVQFDAAPEVDGVFTSHLGVVVGVNTADCVPILFSDSTGSIIAAIHAGWRGTVKQIAASAVKEFIGKGIEPNNIHVYIGASICKDCFEVGDEVVGKFEKSGADMSLILSRDSITGKAHINLKEANIVQIISCGVPRENITCSNECTKCMPNKYFSARTLGIKSGRNFTGIVRIPNQHKK